MKTRNMGLATGGMANVLEGLPGCLPFSNLPAQLVPGGGQRGAGATGATLTAGSLVF